MASAEITAYNAGVAVILDLAKLTAEAFRRHPSWKPTRLEFAAAALEELAESARALLIETSKPE